MTSMDAAAWDERYETAELIWTAEPNRFVVAVLDGATPGTAVDLACGEGRNAVWLAEAGWTVTGVDFSGTGLAKAARLAEHRGVEVAWVQADATTWTAPEPVDLVLVAYLHLPAESRSRMLANAVASCRPGGSVLVVGHARRNLTEGVGGPQDPAVLHDPDEVSADLTTAGATVVEARHVTRPVGDDTTIDSLVLARRS